MARSVRLVAGKFVLLLLDDIETAAAALTEVDLESTRDAGAVTVNEVVRCDKTVTPDDGVYI